MRTIVYHDNCHDGITALWCALQRWPGAEPYAGKYDEPPNLDRLQGRDVVLVDFSWKRPAMLELILHANSVEIYDHHKTAEAELYGLDGATIWDEFDPDQAPPSIRQADVKLVFDMERSGAGIAWDELVGGTRPPLVDYVEDRDLWRFAKPFSREVHAACNCHPLTIEAREVLMKRELAGLIAEGAAALRYHDKLVASAARYPLPMTIGCYVVPTVCCPTVELVSDLCHKLAVGNPFAATWAQKPDGSRVFQLRSTPEGVDVSEIAKGYGGGGHRNAAGFTLAPGAKL